MLRLNKCTMVIFAITMVSAVLLGGCNTGGKTAEELLESMKKEFAQKTSFSADVKLNLDMDYSVDGTSDNMVLSFDEYIDVIMQSKEAYTQGSMKVTDVYDEAWEAFVVKRGDAYASYSCTDGEWYYNDAAEAEIAEGPSALIDIISGIDGYSTKKNDNYVIEAKTDSENILKILDCLYANVIDSAFSEGIDTAGMTGTIVAELDKASYLPLSLKIIFDNCSDMFVGDDMFDSVNINEFILEVAFNEYDRIDDISVPANVAELFGQPEGDGLYDDAVSDNYKDIYFEDENGEVAVDEEGYYELKDYQGIASIKLKSPEGYVFSPDSEPTMVSFDKEIAADGDYCTIIYEMAAVSDDAAAEDSAGDMETYYNFYSTDEAYNQLEYIDNQSTAVKGAEVNYAGLKYYYEGDDYTQQGYYTWYYYWAFIDEYVVMCNVTDCTAAGFTEFDAAAMAEKLFKDISYNFE